MLLKDMAILNDVPDRLRCDNVVNTVSAAPVLRLSLDEGPNGA